MAGQPNSLRSIFFALGANGAIAVAKFAAALYTGSTAMMAEAVHSSADCGNQVLLLVGLKQSSKPPSPEHPLGHGKAVYFWSFLVAIILFSMGGLFSIYEGIHKLSDPQPLTAPWIAVGVLVFAIAAEGTALRACLGEVAKVRGDRGIWQWFRESRRSELIVILGEDVAALAGLSFALLALFAAMATGNPAFDAAGSIGIGVLLVAVAVGIGVEVHHLLLGESADPLVRDAIRAHVAGHEAVAEVLNLITLQMGNDVVVAVKARMRETADAAALVASINACEASLREAFPQVRWLFFEPDVAR